MKKNIIIKKDSLIQPLLKGKNNSNLNFDISFLKKCFYH